MDDFVRNKLTDWELNKWINAFEAEEIDEESFFELDQEAIEKLIPTLGPQLKFKKKLKELKFSLRPEEGAGGNEILPSTSGEESRKSKRKSNHQNEPSEYRTTAKRRTSEFPTGSEGLILKDVKTIMGDVNAKLQNQDDTKLIDFLKTKIVELETDQRELVGVFGKTGAGKSSLINTIIGQRDFLPSGCVSACTSVMIKVEGNRHSDRYEAVIEFITVEEWKDELWSMLQFIRDEASQDDENYREEYEGNVEKLSALYGEEWEYKEAKSLLDNKHFKEIPEFLQSRNKTLSCDTAQELSARFLKYIRSDLNETEMKGIKKWYWPLVKCMTAKVPNCELLQHVTLVDLPGNGDRNRSREKMWKEFVGKCSTIWIVSEVNRAASEQEAWDILKGASSLMGNGGECQRVHFICTKSDQVAEDDQSKDQAHAQILRTNAFAKEKVKKELLKLKNITKHLGKDCLRVFTVSSKEFLKEKYLQPEDTEIPLLQEVLRNLNDSHSETLNYVSGAYGLLSLIQGASSSKTDCKRAAVHAELEESLQHQLYEVSSSVKDAYTSFKKKLNVGIHQSNSCCEEKLKSVLYPRQQSRGFAKTLMSVVEKGGVHKPKRGKQINLNMMLSSCLTDCIDEEFRKTFPNEGKCDLFNGAIRSFSLGTRKLIEKYKDEELQLRFLQTEEDKIKSKLNRIIRDRKKSIYHSLTDTIEESMQGCYQRAAEFKGTNTLQKIRDTLIGHVHVSKNFMFDDAKTTMLSLLKDLEKEIMNTIKETLMRSIELSLKTDDASIPDVSSELQKVKMHLDDLKSSSR